MKALVISFFHAEIVPGGGQQVALNSHRGFIKAGIDSTIIGVHNNLPDSLRSDATPITKLTGKVNEYVCQVNSFNDEYMIADDPWSAKALFDFAIQSKPDVVYIHHFLMVGIDVLHTMRKALPETKFVFIAHEFLSICRNDGHLKRTDGTLCGSQTPIDCVKCHPVVSAKVFSMRQAAFGKFLGAMDFVVTPSKFMHAPLLAAFPGLKKRLRCIPNGSYNSKYILLNFTSKLRRPVTSQAKVGFFGQVLHDKGVLPLANAILEICGVVPTLTLDYWGGNFELNKEDFKQEFLNTVSNVNLKTGFDSIKLKGAFKNEDVLPLMRQYNVVVFPSVWPETFSLVFSEAMLAGVKVVAPAIGAFVERAKLYKGRVFLYAPNEVGGLSAAIKLALKSTPTLDFVQKEDLSIETMAKAYIELIEKPIPIKRLQLPQTGILAEDTHADDLSKNTVDSYLTNQSQETPQHVSLEHHAEEIGLT
jgi:glycosyltransferase involved in cell wall biosynthesis